MNAKRLASGIVVTGILGVALLAGIGTTATAAEAGPKRERVTQRNTHKQKVARRDQRRSTERQRRTEVRHRRGERRTEAVRDRRGDGRRRVDTRHRSIEVRRRAAPQHRPVEIRYRRYDDRRVIVRRVPTYYVPAPVHYIRPWYRTAQRCYVDDSPFYFHAGLGIYLGGVFLNLELTNAAPAGYVYVDPYCDLEFWTVADYRVHLHRHHHRPALRLVQVEYCGY